MKKLTSIKDPLFNTLEKKEMKHVLGGNMVAPTATAAAPINTYHQKSDTWTNDGSTPADPNDQDDKT